MQQALINLLSEMTFFVANSTPIVILDSMLNSLRVKRDNKLDLPTPESPKYKIFDRKNVPIKTILKR